MKASDELADRLAASIEELERQRSSVLALNALKNDLIAVLAHDIKGPLTSIVGFAELLEEGFLEGPAAIDAAKTIRANAQRLATLADDVLALSRVEHGELEIADDRVDLLVVVNDVVRTHLAERNVIVKSSVDRADVRGDAQRLAQVIDNLVRNAIKYSKGDHPVEIFLDRDDDRFVLQVRDRGIGIPPDEIPKLFGRFVRGSNAKRSKIAGTGIGLFIVKSIVERHGGTVAVQSVVGEGSTFTVTLPSADASVSARPMRVSIVTADENERRFAAYELRARGYRVRTCSSLDDLAHVGDLRPGDVVLVDPKLASSAEVRKFAPTGTIRTVALGDPPTRDNGWDAHLSRPFLVNDLLTVLDSTSS